MGFQNSIVGATSAIANMKVGKQVAEAQKAQTEVSHLNLASAQNALVEEFGQQVNAYKAESDSIIKGQKEAKAQFEASQKKMQSMSGLGAKAQESYGLKSKQAFEKASKDLAGRMEAHTTAKSLLQKQYEIIKAREQAVTGVIGAKNAGYLLKAPERLLEPVDSLKSIITTRKGVK